MAYLMLLPVMAYFVIYKYFPMYGLQIAFKNYKPALGIQGSKWVGLKHFHSFFQSIFFGRLIRNTLTISVTSLIFSFPAPIILALLLNEVKSKIVEGKPGESIVFIANEFTYPETELMAICSKKLGMKPVVIDLSVYGINWFQKEDFTYNPAIRACIEAADICVTTCMSFGKLLGSSKAMDGILTGKQRCFAYWAHFMQEWEFDQYQVLMAHKRPLPLRKLIEKSHVLHLTTAKGTDITCQVGLENMNSIYEVCAIVPFFSEVAIIPKFGTVSGVAVVDGASSRFYGEDSVALRTNDFGNRDLQLGPTIMTFEKGVLTKLEGHPVHTERIEKWMNSFTPVANHVDEVGLVTCTDRINDDYQWRVFNDGSHHSNSFHIAVL